MLRSHLSRSSARLFNRSSVHKSVNIPFPPPSGRLCHLESVSRNSRKRYRSHLESLYRSSCHRSSGIASVTLPARDISLLFSESVQLVLKLIIPARLPGKPQSISSFCLRSTVQPVLDLLPFRSLLMRKELSESERHHL